MADYIKEIFCVGIGGALGSVSRYLLEFPKVFANGMYNTVIVNIAGCLLIGVIYCILQRFESSLYSRFLITGLLGGFTTFSAFALHPILMLKNGDAIAAIIYVAATVIFGLLACGIGFWGTDRILKILA